MPVESGRDPGERVQTVPGAAPLLEPRDDPLGGAHPFRELALAEPRLGAQVVDELAEREVVLTFDRGFQWSGVDRLFLISSQRE